jgi:hypothetical protein
VIEIRIKIGNIKTYVKNQNTKIMILPKNRQKHSQNPNEIKHFGKNKNMC